MADEPTYQVVSSCIGIWDWGFRLYGLRDGQTAWCAKAMTIGDHQVAVYCVSINGQKQWMYESAWNELAGQELPTPSEAEQWRRTQSIA